MTPRASAPRHKFKHPIHRIPLPPNVPRTELDTQKTETVQNTGLVLTDRTGVLLWETLSDLDRQLKKSGSNDRF